MKEALAEFKSTDEAGTTLTIRMLDLSDEKDADFVASIEVNGTTLATILDKEEKDKPGRVLKTLNNYLTENDMKVSTVQLLNFIKEVELLPEEKITAAYIVGSKMVQHLSPLERMLCQISNPIIRKMGDKVTPSILVIEEIGENWGEPNDLLDIAIEAVCDVCFAAVLAKHG